MVKTLNSLRNIPFCLCWEPYWLSIVNIYVPVNKADCVRSIGSREGAFPVDNGKETKGSKRK